MFVRKSRRSANECAVVKLARLLFDGLFLPHGEFIEKANPICYILHEFFEGSKSCPIGLILTNKTTDTVTRRPMIKNVLGERTIFPSYNNRSLPFFFSATGAKPITGH
ncbi:hypothetical protein CEXT_32491 [Caerostris extrusa]|uniref:LAGLIDADG homing endonuclease n=1 Tax=Caerostris extrusa TaxID=172846 RepID=A0AAV4MSV2_CAEEX|nr:hypothetical protein CEXT_32491 [Caerostris extrusa]